MGWQSLRSFFDSKMDQFLTWVKKCPKLCTNIHWRMGNTYQKTKARLDS